MRSRQWIVSRWRAKKLSEIEHSLAHAGDRSAGISWLSPSHEILHIVRDEQGTDACECEYECENHDNSNDHFGSF
jgi:hypothetical protein